MVSHNALSTNPLLTIAIPTWNRAAYLAQSLAQLRSEMSRLNSESIEVLISDNCSPDATPEVVESAVKAGMPIRYIRNERNLGWALNFAQAFDLARGKYVLLMGDDDLFVDGALPLVLERLSKNNYGVVCLRAYGFDSDFRREHPGGKGNERTYGDPNRFLVAISRYFTLTSACVLNKSLLSDVDSRQFVSTELAAFHLVLRAALAGERNLFINEYLIASKRQNSCAYEYSEVFVGQMWQIMDTHIVHGLKSETIRTIERHKMLCYYPFYLLDLRLSKRGNLKVTLDHFRRRFDGRWLLTFWLAPIVQLPRPLAILWGGATTAIGRVIDGEFRRGVMFLLARMRVRLRNGMPA